MRLRGAFFHHTVLNMLLADFSGTFINIRCTFTSFGCSPRLRRAPPRSCLSGLASGTQPHRCQKRCCLHTYQLPMSQCAVFAGTIRGVLNTCTQPHERCKTYCPPTHIGENKSGIPGLLWAPRYVELRNTIPSTVQRVKYIMDWVQNQSQKCSTVPCPQ